MNTRNIDELLLCAIIDEVARFYTATKPRIELRDIKHIKPTPISRYRSMNSFAQSILCRIRDNIICNVYTIDDFWNYLILRCANSENIHIERLPTGHEEINKVGVLLSDARFDVDVVAFKKVHNRFVKDEMVATTDIMKSYYECFGGMASLMYRMVTNDAVSPRFYRSGYLRYLEKNPNQKKLSIGVMELNWRKMIVYLRC